MTTNTHISFPSIAMFRNVVRHVQHTTRYRGQDADGKSIYDPIAPLPTIKYVGSEKLHGTNAAIAFNSSGVDHFQSRERIITPTSDNAGFAGWAHCQNWEEFRLTMLTDIALQEDETIVVFGEWCGGNIQKGVAIAQLPKSFVVFQIAKVVGESRVWYPIDDVKRWCRAGSGINNFYCIHDFTVFSFDIDFENPELAQNWMVDCTIKVEQQSPFAKQFNTDDTISSIGEGVVWTPVDPQYSGDPGFWFKVKGELHSTSHVTTLKPVDLDRVVAMTAVAEQVCPVWRLDQMIAETFDTLNGGIIDVKRTGDYIKRVTADIVKEELDVIIDAGFTIKELSGRIATIAKERMFAQM